LSSLEITTQRLAVASQQVASQQNAVTLPSRSTPSLQVNLLPDATQVAI
jgi:hypothetical protein